MPQVCYCARQGAVPVDHEENKSLSAGSISVWSVISVEDNPLGVYYKHLARNTINEWYNVYNIYE